MDDNSFQVVARLDINQSVALIKIDLESIENTLQADSSARLKILAGLDIAKSRNLIQSQLTTIANQANAPNIQVGINVNQNNLSQALQNVQQQANNTTSAVNGLNTAANNAISHSNTANNTNMERTLRRAEVLKSQILAFRQSNTRAEKMFGSNLDDLLNQLTIAPERVDELRARFSILRNEIRTTGNAGKTFGERIAEAAQKFSNWMTLTGLISGAWRVIQRMVSEVIELDTAMTGLKKVTDETESAYAKFLKNTSQQAKDLHSTMNDLIEQTTVWKKLGYSLSEATNLAKQSMIYSKVGEVENKTAVSDMVTAMKAFNIEADSAVTIVDKLNELGNNFATDAGSLGEGLSKSASALNMAGNDINQSLAMLTGGTEITQNASEMGNALKVISMRIRGMKGNLEALGEEYENIESISKTQTHILNLTKGKVNIFDDNGNFRSTYEILKDVSEIFDKLSDTDSADLLETLFGKQRGNQGMAIIQAFQSGQIEKAYQTAINSAGSAQKEFDNWSKSIEAHIETFKASFESLSNTVANSDLFKTVIDGGTAFISTLDKLIDTFGTIPTILGSIAAVNAFRNVGELKNTPPYVPLQFCA